MLNPVPFQLSADQGGLRLGLPPLDRPDARVLDDLGLAALPQAGGAARSPGLGWAALVRVVRRVGSALVAETLAPHRDQPDTGSGSGSLPAIR
ncbi:MAG: hypothetical protein KF723_06245 [Rhizobiaceae bacterium]|nr:hypothetical protein [Rhizobiaceae bacterium]